MREHDSSPARGSPPLCVHAPRQIEKAHPELAKQATPKPASRKKQKKKQEKKKKSLFSCCCGDDEEEGEQDATGFAGDLNISAPMSRQAMAPQRRMMRPGEAPSEMRAEDRKKSMVLRGSRRTTAGAVQLKHLVSKKKLRFIQDGFDLDLSYITPRIIAMGWPSTGKESYYRNSATQVKAFIERYHAGHLKVYNLCKERAYPASLLGLPEAQLEQHGFYDHNAPPLALLRPFCISASRWLEADPLNVIAVHCKAGKGRTGMMISALLLHSGEAPTAELALETFGRKRTSNHKGVTIPSQKRCAARRRPAARAGRAGLAGRAPPAEPHCRAPPPCRAVQVRALPRAQAGGVWRRAAALSLIHI